MALLGARTYDPAVAVSRATTANLAMTAVDTTNLRISFTVPANGAVLVRLQGTMHGAGTFAQVLLGILEGSTVVARVSGGMGLPGTALATTQLVQQAVFVVPGLTPAASLTWDAAYGVEHPVASTGLKYGGPDDGTANNAFGAFHFEIWSTD